MRRFDPERYYATTDPELEVIGSRDALAKLRYRGEGPRYHWVGRRILYLGADLNAYLDSCVIEPPAGPRRRAPRKRAPGARTGGGGAAAPVAA